VARYRIDNVISELLISNYIGNGLLSIEIPKHEDEPAVVSLRILL
jgi:hypothetical protein